MIRGIFNDIVQNSRLFVCKVQLCLETKQSYVSIARKGVEEEHGEGERTGRTMKALVGLGCAPGMQMNDLSQLAVSHSAVQ